MIVIPNTFTQICFRIMSASQQEFLSIIFKLLPEVYVIAIYIAYKQSKISAIV